MFSRTNSRIDSKLALIGLSVAVVLVAAIGSVRNFSVGGSNQSSAQLTKLAALAQLPDRSRITIQLGGKPLTVEVVNSEQSITQGLSGRSTIGSDGMLFVLPSREIATFWMKDMLFPLDLVWIDGSKVIGVTANVPPPAQSIVTALPIYNSPGPVELVLELPAGIASVSGIFTGSQLNSAAF